MPITDKTAIQNLLSKGVSRVIDRDNLEKRLLAGEKLRVKFGIDPSGTTIHIGHMVPILKLRAFQEMGHEVILLIGDATAMVGDTSDKDAERPMLAREQTRANAQVFLEKFAKILDLDRINVYFNSEGLDSVNFAGVGELAKNFSVAEMLDRDNFAKRYRDGVRISLQEFLYPIMQGYDSVAIARKYGSCDVELGGNDQYFNLLAGRTLMHAHGMSKQDIMTFDLLIGPDGKKMSKTSPNCIAIDLEPNAMFVKIMEVKDNLILDYFRLATPKALEEVAAYERRLASWEHPKQVKFELAHTIVEMYHGADAAIAGKAYFEKVLSEGLMPSEDEIEKSFISADSVASPHPQSLSQGARGEGFEIEVGNLLKSIGFCATTGDVRNALGAGSVKVGGEVVSDIKQVVKLSQDHGVIVQMGKKKFRNVFGK